MLKKYHTCDVRNVSHTAQKKYHTRDSKKV